MESEPRIVGIILAFVGTSLFLVVVKALTRNSKPSVDADGAIALHVSKALWVSITLMCGFMVIGITSLVLFVPGASIDDSRELLSVVALLLFFSAGGILFTFIGIRAEMVVSSVGIQDSSGFRRRSIGWTDIKSVTYSESGRDLRLKSSDGRKFSISTFLSGWAATLPYLKQHVPTDRFDAAARKFMRAQAPDR